MDNFFTTPQLLAKNYQFRWEIDGVGGFDVSRLAELLTAVQFHVVDALMDFITKTFIIFAVWKRTACFVLSSLPLTIAVVR